MSYACRCFRETTLGRGFDSRRLHSFTVLQEPDKGRRRRQLSAPNIDTVGLIGRWLIHTGKTHHPRRARLLSQNTK